MRIFLRKKSYFTFRGKQSYELSLCGKTVFELMRERLGALEGEGEGERIELDPVYPFLTREELFTYLDGREGSYPFPGGMIVRAGCPLSAGFYSPPPWFALLSPDHLPQAIGLAERESARLHGKRGALVEEGARVSYAAKLENGAIVRKGAMVLGESFVGRGAEIGSGSVLSSSRVGAGTVVEASMLDRAEVGEHCTVGPNACLRPFSRVGDDCRIGNFVELKNATIGRGSKIAHLAYVGDAVLGERVNVGCGAVFVNYDGREKHRIEVGDGCFIGSNCNLIAPLRLERGAFIAAGTTLTHDLHEDDFCIGRCGEVIKPNRAHDYYDPK